VDRNEEAAEERARHERRTLDVWIDEDGSWVVRGRLDPEAGALLARALDAAAEALDGKKKEPAVTASQKRADAIGLLAETALQSGFEPDSPVHRTDRFQVVVHVDAEALRSESDEGQSVLEGVRVPAETSRRLACDARVEVTNAADAGADSGSDAAPVCRTRTIPPAPATRRTRTIPAAIRRALEHRDRGCRFPGCGLRFCDAHHVVHWADGGATALDNLLLLCRRHHRKVHERGGFRLEIRDGRATFSRPDGSLLEGRAPP
jgi:hypothetical protein